LRRCFTTSDIRGSIFGALVTRLLDRVARNELDMAVVAGESPTGELRARPIAEDRLVALTSSTVASALGRRVEIARVARAVTWLLREPGSDTRRQVDRWFERHRLMPARTLTLVGPDALVRAAENGLGLAVVSSRCADAALAGRRLAIVDVRPRLPVRRYSVVDHPHKHHGAACQAMLAHLDRAFHPAEPLAPGAAPTTGAASGTPARGRRQGR
jgi:DNA-binding transcriptional LysR family regulator